MLGRVCLEILNCLKINRLVWLLDKPDTSIFKESSNKLASVSVEFCVCNLLSMVHSGGYNMVIHHRYCRAAGGINVGIHFDKNAIPLGFPL